MGGWGVGGWWVGRGLSTHPVDNDPRRVFVRGLKIVGPYRHLVLEIVTSSTVGARGDLSIVELHFLGTLHTQNSLQISQYTVRGDRGLLIIKKFFSWYIEPIFINMCRVYTF